MTDYLHPCGNSGTMMIRDNGGPSTGNYTVEFWINSNNSTTWTDHLPWGGTVNGVGVGGSYYYHPNSGWNRLGVWNVWSSQNVTFSLGNTGTSGFGSGTSFSAWIPRATVPPAPNPVQFNSVTSTSVHAWFSGNGDGGSGITAWQIAFDDDINATSLRIFDTFDAVFGDLTPGTTYYFWARGVNGVGAGPWSSRTQVTLLRVPGKQDAPTLSQITQVSVATSFRPNSDTGGSNFTGYQIGYGTNINSPASGGTISTPGDATVLGLQPATKYYFWTRAQNAIGWGPWSDPSSATTIAGAWVKVGSTWKQAIPYVKDGGVWKLARVWTKNGGVWKETS